LKKLLLTSLVSLNLLYGVNISQTRDATINVYGVGAKTDKDQDSSAGMGLMFDHEDIKVKMEGTSDFFKMGGVYKFSLFNPNLYFKVGANYINQKMYSPVDTSTRVNQYSGALATGYMISNDFYVEIGGSYTQLDGDVFGDYEVRDETTSLAYLEVAKRWESAIGTIDTTANGGQVFHEYRDNEFSYGLGVDYYPMNNAKLSYTYQHEENNIANTYAAQYSFLFVEYADNISLDTYQVNAGVKVAFDDLFDISTYRAPTNIKSHLSELHRFESITFATNMEVQSSAGVQKTAAAIARDAVPDTPAISTPTISMADQTINDNGGFGSTDLPAPTVTDVQAGVVYSIVNDPTSGMLTINSSTGVATWNGDLLNPTDYTITIKVVNPDGGTATTTFTLTVLDNG
jgi:hypothetical protein